MSSYPSEPSSACSKRLASCTSSRGNTQPIQRSRLFHWLDQDIPLAIMHGQAGAGKSELLAQWMAARPDRHFIPASAPLTARDFSALFRVIPNNSDGARPTIVIDDVDRDLPTDVERMLFDSLKDHEELRIVVSGRCTSGLEARAQRSRVRSTILFGEDLLATMPEVAAIAAVEGRSAVTQRVRELFDLTGGWLEPTRLVLEESRAGELAIDAAKRWVVNVALRDLDEDDLALMERLTLLDRIDSETIRIGASTPTSSAISRDRFATLQDAGILSGDGKSVWVITPIVRAVMEDRINSMTEGLARTRHTEIAGAALALEPKLFIREILRHSCMGRAWTLLERFWNEHSGSAMNEYPHETRAAFAGIPEHVVNRSTTLAVARAISAGTTANDGVLERLARYSDQHRFDIAASPRISSTDTYIETTVIRILQLRRIGQLAEAHELGNRAECELSRRIGNGARRPTAANSALLLIQHAMNRMLTLNEGASAAELARRALGYARASRIESLTSAVLGYLAALRAASGWSAPTQQVRTQNGPEFARETDSPAVGHDVARAMAGVDRLDREQSGSALDRADSHTGAQEIWPLAALAQSRHFLFFETANDLDDYYRHLVWSHPEAREGAGTGRMILDWSGVLADLRAGRLAEAERRIAESKVESSWMSVLEARLHLSKLNHEEVLDVTSSAMLSDGIGNRERSQFLFMGATSSLMLGKEQEASLLFQRARSLADKHGLRSTYLAISRDQRAELFALVGDKPPHGTAARLDELPDAFPERSPVVGLSVRETQVLHGIAKRASHREIAGALHISVPTVRSHVRTLYAKLAVGDGATAVGRAGELGLLLGTDLSWEWIRSLYGAIPPGT